MENIKENITSIINRIPEETKQLARAGVKRDNSLSELMELIIKSIENAELNKVMWDMDFEYFHKNLLEFEKIKLLVSTYEYETDSFVLDTFTIGVPLLGLRTDISLVNKLIGAIPLADVEIGETEHRLLSFDDFLATLDDFEMRKWSKVKNLFGAEKKDGLDSVRFVNDRHGRRGLEIVFRRVYFKYPLQL